MTLSFEDIRKLLGPQVTRLQAGHIAEYVDTGYIVEPDGIPNGEVYVARQYISMIRTQQQTGEWAKRMELFYGEQEKEVEPAKTKPGKPGKPPRTVKMNKKKLNG